MDKDQMLEIVKALKAELGILSRKDRSDDIGLIMEALAKAQAEMAAASKDSINPFHKSKYADLHSIIEASRPALTKNGLAVSQQVSTDAHGKMILVTTLGHASGQYISSVAYIRPLKEDIQSLGSYITYLRRYTYAPLVGVSVDDDDGETAMTSYRGNRQEREIREEPEEYEKVSSDQYKELKHQMRDMSDFEASILKYYKCSSLKDIPADAYRIIMEKIEKRKVS